MTERSSATCTWKRQRLASWFQLPVSLISLTFKVDCHFQVHCLGEGLISGSRGTPLPPPTAIVALNLTYPGSCDPQATAQMEGRWLRHQHPEKQATSF